MWPFRKRSEAPSDLRDEVETLKRRVKTLEGDWLEFEDRVKRKVWRDAKAAQRGAAAAAEADTGEAAAAEVPAPPDRPQVDPVSARILALRKPRRLVGPGIGG